MLRVVKRLERITQVRDGRLFVRSELKGYGKQDGDAGLIASN